MILNNMFSNLSGISVGLALRSRRICHFFPFYVYFLLSILRFFSFVSLANWLLGLAMSL